MREISRERMDGMDGMDTMDALEAVEAMGAMAWDCGGRFSSLINHCPTGVKPAVAWDRGGRFSSLINHCPTGMKPAVAWDRGGRFSSLINHCPTGIKPAVAWDCGGAFQLTDQSLRHRHEAGGGRTCAPITRQAPRACPLREDGHSSGPTFPAVDLSLPSKAATISSQLETH